jgi:hypothetical protein
MLMLSKKKVETPPDGDTTTSLIVGSGKIKLREQPLIIQDLLHRRIAKASEDVILVRTWPEVFFLESVVTRI